ncbi:MAG: transporter [Micavibrio sp.]|nr:transporter [Micavibrio sp.]
MRKSGLLLSSLAAALFVTGCSLTPDYERPDVQTPAWRSSLAQGENAQIAVDWWKNYNSEELDFLIQKALSHNNNLQAALHRVEQARGDLQMAGAELLPSASVTAAYMSGSTVPMNVTDMRNNGIPQYTVNAGIGYELDLFGANRAQKAAAIEALKESEYAYDALALVIMGDVAQTYLNVLNLQERYQIARDNLQSTKELLQVAEARFQIGARTSFDIAQQETVVSNAKAELAGIEQELAVSKNALALLVGEPPQSFDIKGVSLKGMMLPEIAVLQPASLLERRPDIKVLEAQLKAANADIGAARGAFYPSVNIGANLIKAFDPAATALTLASSVYAPIFQGGRLEGNLKKVTARQKELAENYQQTVLSAFKEAEDSIVRVQTTQKRETALRQSASKARKAYDIAKNQYELSVLDFQNVLDAQRMMLEAEDNYARARFETLSASIDLFKAMGGGWKDEQQLQGDL